MKENGYSSAEKMSSFELESLLWNITNNKYGSYQSHRFVFEELLKFIIKDFNKLNEYKEANGIKTLFPTDSKINDCIAFINDLSGFYD